MEKSLGKRRRPTTDGGREMEMENDLTVTGDEAGVKRWRWWRIGKFMVGVTFLFLFKMPIC